MRDIHELPFNHLDDDSFELVMYEMSNGPVNFDSDRLASLKCNPLSLDKYTNLSLSHDINPDSNFFSDTFNCEYYTESSLNGLIHENALNTEGLSLFHINIRSIRCNFSRLTNLLSSINNKFSIIGISETWLQDSSHTVDIEGYNFVHNYRPDRSGGGVGLYLTTELEYKFRNDLTFPSQTSVESLFVEITNVKGKNIIVGIVYRPPRQNVNDFNNNLNLLMEMISKENKVCYLIGDFNLDLLNNHGHLPTGEFLDIMFGHMLFPLITLPTRITSHTATLIDGIFTNHSENYLCSGLLLSDISDHLPIFCITRDRLSDSNEETYMVFRDKNEANIAKFQSSLTNCNWYSLDGFYDPLKAYESFLNKYRDIYNSCFPLKRVRKRKCNLSKPWLSKGLLKSIRRKNRLYKRYLNTPNDVNQASYKKYKNKLNHSLRIAKRIYYDKQLDYFKTNTKRTWQILNEVINRKKRTNKLTSTFVSNDKEISSPNEVANHFCKYFTNIGINLAKDISNSTVSHRSYLSGNYVNSMSLELTTEEEIVEIINSLRSGTAAGYDNIPISALKNSVSLISEPIAHIINLSISSGIVPDLMKIARVIPLFKSGDHRYFQNYRPVSVLPIFSKLLERVVFKRITNYIDKSSILSDNQYRFRKKHSTSPALMRLYDGIASAID